MAVQKGIVENLWREFFLDPSQWVDHRAEKVNFRYPDFKRKKTQEGLWIDSKFNPPWLEAELATLTRGTVPLNNFSWNQNLRKLVKAGDYEKTLELFHQMQQHGRKPDEFTFVPVINACTGLQAFEEGRLIHKQIIESGSHLDVYVGSCLVNMYAKCGSIEEAWNVFNKMPTRNVVAWSAMILGCAKCGQGEKALELSRQMEQEGVQPNSVTFLGLLNACASIAVLEEGRRVHKQITDSGLDSDVYVGGSLVDMYAKCGSIDDAWRVFNRLTKRSAAVWTAMILGYVKCGQGHKALELSRQLLREGVNPDPVTFVAMLNSCASVLALEEGRLIHQQVNQSGCASDMFVSACLVDMYAKCGSIGDAVTVFNEISTPNVVAWTAMIIGYVKCGQGHKALELSRRMEQEGLDPDSFIFVGILNACASVMALDEGRHVHKQIISRGWESNVFVGNGLVDMYAKCGSVEDAWRVFNKMTVRDTAVWNAMILGYVTCEQGLTALELYQQMQSEGVEPDTVTFLVLLNACASVAALANGMNLHEQIIVRGWEFDRILGNGLVDMYVKCGSLENARKVFDKLPLPDVISWTIMLGGYAMHGNTAEALAHFKRMQQESVQIDGVTFVSLISACSHGGLVEQGLHYFESMSTVHEIPVTMEHYACVVDLLGRAGSLQEAEELTMIMPFHANATLWMSLLGACRVHGNVEIAERIAKKVIDLDPANPAGYVLLSNIYSAAGKWNCSADMQRGRLERGIQKQEGKTWIEVNNEVHSFILDDQNHPQIVEIHAELDRFLWQMEQGGYVPDTIMF